MSKEELNMAGQGKGISDDMQEKWCFYTAFSYFFQKLHNCQQCKNYEEWNWLIK